ncbi:MAG: mechanosensitive ion channel [Oscillatoria sp. PMC 1068.18]|nr:mechanosensitive ion channel [Oscillatoria sp. PMC 1076.18]MEC4990767.1 mechanosensitive ion channel [Oscillatoria sp. PMC 1068.18]
MENFLDTIKDPILATNDIVNKISFLKIILVVTVFTLSLALRQFFSTVVIKRIEALTSNTENHLDDELVRIIKEPLSWLVFVAGLWLIQVILSTNLSPDLNELALQIISFVALTIVAYIVFYAAPVLGKFLEKLTLKTETELDDLLVPYLPKLFRLLAIAVVFLKGSEVFLGASAGALIGLLGGAGVALGLLFKDLIYDLCCTVIIYTDNLFRFGDLVSVEGIDGLLIVNHIGLRSTTLSVLTTNALKKMPNSKMINGVVENWSQSLSVGEEKAIGITLTLQIDSISAEQTARFCNSLREIPKLIDNLSTHCFIWFSGINQNARVIQINVFAKVSSPELYFQTIEEVNLEILKILEKEKIEMLSSLSIEVISAIEHKFQSIQAIEN